MAPLKLLTSISQSSLRKHNRRQQLKYEALDPRQLLAGDVSLTTFDDGAFFQIQSNLGRVAEVNFDVSTFVTAANRADTRVEAAGFRQADGLAYGIRADNFELGRFGANGQFQDLGSVSGLPTDAGLYRAGDFGGDGLFYVMSSNQNDSFFGINVETMSVENTISLSETLNNVWDFAFSPTDSSFFANKRGPTNQLLKIGMNGTVDHVGHHGDIHKQTIGAMYADAQGNIYGVHNAGGEVYRFDKTSGHSYQIGTVSKMGANDGFSDPTQAFDFAPFASDDLFASFGTLTQGNVLDGEHPDFDGNGDSLTVTKLEGNATNIGALVTLESGATVQLSSDGNFDYDPSSIVSGLGAGELLEDNFTYTINDSQGNQASAMVTFRVTNDPPIVDLADVSSVEDSSDGQQFTSLSTGNPKVHSASVGDINGDGITDLAYGIEDAFATGQAHIIFGTLDPTLDWSSEKLLSINGGDGSEGFVLNGVNFDDLTGHEVAGGGDFNGDGIADLVIGAKDADTLGRFNNGAAYVFFGKSGAYQAEYQLADLFAANGGDGSTGFVIHGADSNDLFSDAVTMGDINADGLSDVVVAASNADPNGKQNAGETFVVFGTTSNIGAEFDTNALYSSNGGDGSAGFVIQADVAHDLLGYDISMGGDFNNDGFEDLVLGSEDADHFVTGQDDVGAAYVIYGASQFDAEFDLAIDTSHSRLYSSTHCVMVGTALASGGDFNGDGFDDLLIGAPHIDVGDSHHAGRAYVVYGSENGFDKRLTLENLHPENGGDGTKGMTITGIAEHDELGSSVASAGDFNGDGIADIILGAEDAERTFESSGEAYVLFGSTEFGASLDLSSLLTVNGGTGEDGVIISGLHLDQKIGQTVLNAGDINGDGLTDVFVMGTKSDADDYDRFFAQSFLIFGFDPLEND